MDRGADSRGIQLTASSTRRPQPFTASLRPHRSLGRCGFLALMSVLGGISFVVGLGFVFAGAWPVAGFLGLDLVLISAAFHAYNRAACAEERIELAEGRLLIRRRSHRGEDHAFAFNPYWVRLALMKRPDGSNELSLSMQGKRLVIAAFLSAHERTELAHKLSAALASHRS
jgi:uncharacterized membrane protein